ncbi:uncharacterized protein EI97DRAFT_201480 [Westerdykella ornata]|uniref:Methyltransferase domain-containing protein n=1 Tax=Westerdykella ornata TaxID=318751 RepID=A0A6A6JAH5_WESOR|nr:uncharacterized protein EI97DRAFT_201480 [Westerdykella ornata]KAF2272626.1 hypothetical protein EI97DRAFT_201480 [Westerdykella ornata]
MGPDTPLPLPPDFTSVDDYVDSLLKFSTTSWLLQTLCGGVHVLDFYTRSPNLYTTLLPESWRVWFKNQDIMDILDLLMREDLSQFDRVDDEGDPPSFRGGPAPPEDLLQYIKDVRKHLLAREFPPPGSEMQSTKSSIARHVAVGMKVKKVHEVDNFARYVDKLTSDIAASGKKEITHLVDFGSGQNYLGRALAAPPYCKHIVAVESKQHNIAGAKNMDVLAKLVPKPVVMRNKKEFRGGQKRRKKGIKKEEPIGQSEQMIDSGSTENEGATEANCESGECGLSPAGKVLENGTGTIPETTAKPSEESAVTTTLQIYTEGHGSVQYVEHIIKDGDLSPVVNQILDTSKVPEDNLTTKSNVVEEPSNLTTVPRSREPNLMVISLHSCGNLVHHGLRSLLLNPAVSAVAMVGCCYNLLTERLGPPTYKLPTLRPNHPRLTSTSNAFDPHGFPMSEKLATCPLPHEPLLPVNEPSEPSEPPRGLRLNITARMMAVQAPFNWGPEDSELFFTRHFYRALLQRIFLDRGIVAAPVDADGLVGGAVSAAGTKSRVTWMPPNGRGPGLSSDGTTTPLTIGTLRKFAYKDFVSYVRAAIAKLTTPNSFCEVDPEFIKSKIEGLTDDDIRGYEEAYRERKKELSVMWSLMAFSAGVVEAVIVTDRWLWLREQEEIEHAWVEPVFEYKQSPRNLVVVGIKK